MSNRTPYLQFCVHLQQADEFAHFGINSRTALWATFRDLRHESVGYELERALRADIKSSLRARRAARDAEIVRSINFTLLHRRALLRIVVEATMFLTLWYQDDTLAALPLASITTKNAALDRLFRLGRAVDAQRALGLEAQRRRSVI